jgi:hypothetical protein
VLPRARYNVLAKMRSRTEAQESCRFGVAKHVTHLWKAQGATKRRERLGGMLSYYHREAA